MSDVSQEQLKAQADLASQAMDQCATDLVVVWDEDIPSEIHMNNDLLQQPVQEMDDQVMCKQVIFKALVLSMKCSTECTLGRRPQYSRSKWFLGHQLCLTRMPPRCSSKCPFWMTRPHKLRKSCSRLLGHLEELHRLA